MRVFKYCIGFVALFAAVVFAGVFVSSAISEWRNHKIVIDPNSRNTSQVDLLHDPAFRFKYGDGGFGQYDVISVDANGNCRYQFQVPSTDRLIWRQADFTVDAATLRALRQLLVEINFTELPKEDFAVNVVDGTQRFADLQLTGYKKKVFWSNSFPASQLRLNEFIQSRILRPRESAFKNAPTTVPVKIEADD